MSAPTETQVVFVGSGINSLVGAALLAVRGKRVLVLERNDRLGGCIRTEELFPGYRHEVFSSWHPLFVGSPGYAELKSELEQAGLEVLCGDYSTGLVGPDGRGLALRQDMADAARRLDALSPGDGQALQDMAARMFGEDAALTFGLLGKNPYSWDLLKLLYSEWRKRGLDGMTAFAAGALENFRRWSERTLRSDARALIAPWTLHSGLGPDDASSALIGKLTFAAVVSGGMPVIKGGGSRLVEALARVIENRGGQLLTNAQVDRVLVEGQGRRARAVGVQLADGGACAPATPWSATSRRNNSTASCCPTRRHRRARAQAYRYGRGCMQLHFALNAPPAWTEPELVKVPLVHLTESLEQVCASVTEANNGLLPSRPTLAIGQPVAVDPSRAPGAAGSCGSRCRKCPRA